MKCTKAFMKKDSNIATFTFVTEDSPPLQHTVEIDYVNEVEEKVQINFFSFEGKREFIENKIESASVYIPNQEDLKLFSYTFQYLTQFYNHSTTIRTMSYPGKDLIIIDYGLYSITKEMMGRLIKSIVDGIVNKQTVTVEEEEEVPLPTSAENLLSETSEASEYPLPFSDVGGEFIEEDNKLFGMGMVVDD